MPRMSEEMFYDAMVRSSIEQMSEDTAQICREAIRARGGESRLAKEVVKKDAIIKALADAVELSGEYLDGDWHSSGCPGWDVRPGPCGESCARRRAALRLAGRLP